MANKKPLVLYNGIVHEISGGDIVDTALISQSIQTENMVSVQGSTGPIIFSNSNGVSFGGNNGTITASHNGVTSQTVQTQSNVQGISAGTQVGHTGDIVFSNSNGLAFGLSNSSVLTGSYTVPTVTNSSWTVSDANTSGTVGRLAFTNANGLTLSLSTSNNGNHTVIGSYTVPNVTNSSLSLSDNVTSMTIGRLAFTNQNGITLTLSTTTGGSATLVGSHNALTSQSNQSAIKAFGASNTGNTAGNTGVSTGVDWVVAGSNNITINESTAAGGPNTLWVSGPNTSPAQTGISSIVLSNTTYTSGQISFRDGNGLSWASTTGQGISLTHGLQFTSNTSAITSNALNTSVSRVINIVAATDNTGGGTTSLSSNVSFSNANNLTFYTSAGGAIVGSFSQSVDTRKAGTGFTSAGNNIGLSGTLNTNGLSLSATVAAGTNSSMTVSDAATSGTLARLAFTNLNGVTLSLSTGAGGSHTIVGSHNAITSQTSQSAIKAFGASNTGNTAGNTGLSTGIDWVLAGSNNITVSQSTAAGGPNTLWVSGANAGGAQTGISGAALSNTTYTSGTISFRDGNGISWASTTGQGISLTHGLQFTSNTSAITSNALNTSVSRVINIVAATNNTGGGTASLSSNVSFSNANNITFYTSAGSAVVASFSQSVDTGKAGTGFTSAGNNIGLSGTLNTNGLSLSATVAAQTVQTIGLYGSSQTTGSASSGTYDARSISFIGAGMISVGDHSTSVGGTTTGFIISAPASSVFRASTDAIGLNTAKTNVTWTVNSSGISLDGGAYLTSQTIQSAIKGFGASNTGNTAGNTGLSTGIDWVVAGSNNITISQSTAGGGPNTLWVSGPSVAGAQTAISGIQVSDTTYTSGTVTFRNANGISFGSSGAQGISASYTVPTLTSWTVSDNATSATVGRLAFTQSNGLTLSLSTSNNGNHTVIGSYTVPTVTNSSMSVSDAATSGTLARLAFTNLNGLTLSLSTGAGGSHTIVGSHNGLTSQSTDFNAITLGGNTAGTTTFHATNNRSIFLNGGNGITLSGNGSTITISGITQSNQSAIKGLGATNTGNTAGNTGLSTGIDWVIAGSNNITISQSTAGGGPNTLWVSGPNVGGAQTGISGIQVSDTTYTSGTVTFRNANGISFGSSGAQGISASYTVPTLTSWTVSDNATSATVGRLAFTQSNGLTLSLSTSNNGNHTVIGSHNGITSQSSQSAIKGLGISNTGNTAGNTGLSSGIDWVIAGSGIATASQSTAGGGPNTIWINVPSGGGAGDGGNTIAAGTRTATSSGVLLFSNSNNFTWGLDAVNGSVMTASYSQSNQNISLFALGNTTQNSSTVLNANALSFSAPSPGVSIGFSNGSIIISNYPHISSYENIPGAQANNTVSFNGVSVSGAVAFFLPQDISASFLRFSGSFATNQSTTIATLASATATGSGAVYSTWNAVVYSLGTGASSKSLISVASGSNAWTFSQQISVTNSTQASYSLGYTANAEGASLTRTTQYSISNTNYSFTTNQFSDFASLRMLDINFNNSLPQGNYWLVVGYSSSSQSGGAVAGLTNCNVRYSGHYVASINNVAVGIMGSSNLTSGGLLGAGSFSTAGGGTTSILPISAISSSASNARIYFQLLRSV